MTLPQNPLTAPASLAPSRPGLADSAPNPQWAAVFEKYLANGPGGYAWAVGLNGTQVDSGAWGYARMPQDTPDSQGIAFTPDSRCNLASVSKTVTAAAVFKMIQKSLVTSVNDLFWPYAQTLYPSLQPAAGVETVTIAELLTMISRLPEDGTLYTDNGISAVDFIAGYLQANALIPDQLYVYSNTNFTILQAMIDGICAQAGNSQDYVSWVQSQILAPLGIDLAVFSPVPDADDVATLSYDPDKPGGYGAYWPQMQCVGPGGWISSANALLTYLMGFRKGRALPFPLVQFMTSSMLGWYPGGTSYGVAYHHNGGLTTGSGEGLSTGVIRFPDGYDAVLLSNKPVDDIIGVMLEAFDA